MDLLRIEGQLKMMLHSDTEKWTDGVDFVKLLQKRMDEGSVVWYTWKMV